MTTVQYVLAEGVATITLDRPESLNSMTDELMIDLRGALRRVVDDESVRVAVLTGAGRGFCSGADLSAVNQVPEDAAENTEGRDHFNNAIRELVDLPVPTIARVNGVAAGGGFGLAMGCDITIAVRSTFFVATFVPRLGIVPDLGTTWHLSHRVGRARARAIAMLGERIPADRAEEWGLIWKAVDDADLDSAVGEVVEVLRRSSPDAMTRLRSTLDVAATNTLSEQLDVEMDHQAVLIPRNMAEGAAAFLEKREPKFDGRRTGS